MEVFVTIKNKREISSALSGVLHVCPVRYIPPHPLCWEGSSPASHPAIVQKSRPPEPAWSCPCPPRLSSSRVRDRSTRQTPGKQPLCWGWTNLKPACFLSWWPCLANRSQTPTKSHWKKKILVLWSVCAWGPVLLSILSMPVASFPQILRKQLWVLRRRAYKSNAPTGRRTARLK